ncbi:MAG: YafY family protein, partial [Myxococcota bacterium]
SVGRASRLLELMQVLRRYRTPVAAHTLAAELGVSVRSVYRDVAALRDQGATIDGEAGVGYLLQPGFALPPLMFVDEELEALVLGLRLVAQHGDEALGHAAADVLAKVRAVLPRDLRRTVDESALFAGPRREGPPLTVALAEVRQSIRDARKVRVTYVDEAGRSSDRVIWPLGLAFFERVRLVVAWCEARADFRTFRVDRFSRWDRTTDRFDRPRRALLAEWRARESIPAPIGG